MQFWKVVKKVAKCKSGKKKKGERNVLVLKWDDGR